MQQFFFPITQIYPILPDSTRPAFFLPDTTSAIIVAN